jgi:N-acetylglutamate synthase-like GNAT family acetyltransferase
LQTERICALIDLFQNFFWFLLVRSLRFKVQLSFSPIAGSDDAFLLALYASVRADEMAMVPWSDEQKSAFLKSQYDAQHLHYTEKYPQGSFQIIKSGDKKIGRLYTAELADEIRIIDILISSEFRGKKIGTTLIAEILRGADEKNKAVQIYLDADDRSANLFARLGFAPVADEGIYQLWQRPANSRTNTAEA